jgi:CsoR family transcriptional regulator, copper-sensing transcriptional repressor
MGNNDKQKIVIGLKKAQTLIGKVIEMSEENEYCIKIMQQNLAAIGLLKSANQGLLEGHLNSCFKAVMASSNKKKQDEMIKEILQINKLTNK